MAYNHLSIKHSWHFVFKREAGFVFCFFPPAFQGMSHLNSCFQLRGLFSPTRSHGARSGQVCSADSTLPLFCRRRLCEKLHRLRGLFVTNFILICLMWLASRDSRSKRVAGALPVQLKAGPSVMFFYQCVSDLKCLFRYITLNLKRGWWI